MKVFKVEADTKGAVKNLKDVETQTIKAISAQEVLQGILTSPAPLKNIEKIIPAYIRLGDTIDKMNKLSPPAVKQRQEAFAIEEKGTSKQLEASKKISNAHKKRLNELKEERKSQKEQFEALKQEIEEKQLLMLKDKMQGKEISEENKKWINDANIRLKELADATTQNSEQTKNTINETLASMTAATDEYYKEAKEHINLKYNLEAQEIRNSCDMTIAAENEKMGIKKASAEDEEAMKVSLNIKLKDLEERRNEALKKNEQEHLKARASVIDNFLKERSTNLIVYEDTTTKKVEAATKKTAKELSDFFKGVDKETADSIIKQAIRTQDASKAATETVKKETATTKEATDATKEATDATKKYVNIQQTRSALTSHIEELQKAKQTYLNRVALYDQEIAAASDNEEKRKEIENKKLQYIKENAAAIIKVNEELNGAEKQQQDLGILQWEQYAKKAEEVTNSIKGVTGKVADYFSTAFTAVSNVYKAEIEGIDEDIKHLKAKNAEVIQEAESQSKKIAALDAEQKNAAAAGMTEHSNSLLKQIEVEKAAYQESLETKNKIEAKERELQAKKAKKQAEQEKIEKLNRKATLLKNIGEAISNVSQGVTKALSYGPFLGPVLAAVVATAGAVQVGIMTKQLAKFADGGLLNGKRHAQGGMRIEGSNIEVEGGEYVVNRESTSKNLGLVRYINSERRELKPADINSYFNRLPGFSPSPLERAGVRSGGASYRRMFEDGGQLPAIETTKNIDNESLIQAIRSIRIEPRVAVTDIHRVQDSMVGVDGWTGV